MERLLLIGGTGHLGYAIISEIYNFWKNKDIFITVLTRSNNLPNYFPINNSIKFEKYDPQNTNALKSSIEAIKPTTIIYLASDNNNQDTSEVYISSEVNLFLPIKILFLIKEVCSDTKYIFLSSKLAKLDSNKYCLYSLNKYFAEEYIKKFSQKYNLTSISIKLPTLFGPGDLSKRRLIPSYIKGTLKNIKISINENLQKKLFLVSSKEISTILMKKILNNESIDLTKSIESIQYQISIGDLLKIIDLIHSSYSKKQNNSNSFNYIKNYKEINKYEMLYEQLFETYDFLCQNVHLL